MELNKDYIMINSSYGGKQDWLYESGFIKKKEADKSCGVTACANVFYYIKNEKNKDRIKKEDEKANYLEIMKDLYIILRPRFYGIPSLNKMKRGMLKYAMGKGLYLRAYKKGWFLNKVDQSDFIKNALLEGHPVLILTWNFKDPQFKNHWVTLTGWEEKDGEALMIGSNWGIKKTYSYTKWMKGKSLFKGALYFKE